MAAAILAALSAVSTSAAAERPSVPGEGVYCALAIYSVVNQVAAVCRPDESPELRAELRNAVDRLSTYVVQNGGGSLADVKRFMQEQGGVGRTPTELCRGQPLFLYEGLRKSGPQPLRKLVDAATARPGKPTWGTCL